MPNSLVLSMPYSTIRTLLARVGIAGILLGAAVADAQVTPGMGPGMGPGGGPQQPANGNEEKKEGVAEAAPKQAGLLPTTPALPTAKGRRKKWKLVELDGYYRLRTDWFRNFNLGFFDDPGSGGSPFPRALGCTSTALNHPCDDSVSSANMRLRLEPTINLDEGTSVHIQADALDNLVLGSTPSGIDNSGVYNTTNKPPVGAFTSSQTAPVRGVNGTLDSITVKRAWGEIALPLGILKFGRMPNQWGMGIYYNAGGMDPVSGVYNYDADYGDSVDRVSFSTLIPGTNLRAMVAMDWDTTRLISSQQTSTNIGHEGHPYDLDDSDDTNGWVGVISRMDTAQEFQDTVDRGELALNYGIYFEYKTQSWDDDLTGFTPGVPFAPGTHYVPRNMKTYSPDVWLKLGYGPIVFEAEAIAQLGSVGNLDDAGLAGEADIRKFGGVGRLTYYGLERKLKIGLESGFASGDQWDNNPQGNTNIAYANQLGGPGDTTLSQFIFNKDYIVDMILWRNLEGAVNNAAYGKPFLSYEITKSIGFKVSNITSFALVPVATPGNGVAYGTEFNIDVHYQSGGLYAGIAYGILFPFGAMAHPADAADQGGKGFGWGTDANGNSNSGDPGTAHCIQTRLVLSF